MTKNSRTVAFATAAMLALASCATGPSRPMTQMERVAATCIASVALGAIAGAVIGNNSGSGDAGRGAAYGAAAGGVVCAVVAAMSARDKQELAQQQTLAASTGRPQTVSYVGDDGRMRTITTTARTADPSYVDARIAEHEAAVAAIETANAAKGKTDASSMKIAFADPRACRMADSTVEIQGQGQAQLKDQLVCRTADNQWLPVPTTSG